MARESVLLLRILLASSPLICALWVLRDARAHVRVGHRVGVYFRNIQLDSPEAWAIACLFLWILAFPLYLTARAQS